MVQTFSPNLYTVIYVTGPTPLGGGTTGVFVQYIDEPTLNSRLNSVPNAQNTGWQGVPVFDNSQSSVSGTNIGGAPLLIILPQFFYQVPKQVSQTTVSTQQSLSM